MFCDFISHRWISRHFSANKRRPDASAKIGFSWIINMPYCDVDVFH